MWVQVLGLVLALVAVALGAALVFGAVRWRLRTRSIGERLGSARGSTGVSEELGPKPASTYESAEVEGLPGPVARYFRRVLTDGQGIITRARLVWEGEFRTGDSQESWRPFDARQVFVTDPPGFLWDARIRTAPAVAVRVRDSYADGTGAMRGELLRLIPVVDLRGSREIAEATLQRYLAEAVWFPTALLPGQYVDWVAIDGSRARATLTDGRTVASLEFRFGEHGEVESVYTPARYRAEDEAREPTPWLGRYAKYSDIDGIRIPLEGEVEWQPGGRPFPYWRGRVVRIEYEHER